MASAIDVARDSVISFAHLLVAILSLNPLVDDATLFSVKYFNNYKVVTNSYVNITYVLTQCGTTPPSPSLFSNTTVFFDIPVKTVASLATTAVSYLEMLGERVAITEVDTEGLVSSPCVQLGLEQNEIIGLADTNATLRAEQLKAVDLVFSSYASDPLSANKTVITSEVNDPGPLNVSLLFFFSFLPLDDKQSQYLRPHISEEKKKVQTSGSLNLVAEAEPT